MVFDGEELLEFAVRSIRSEVDHISVTYQSVSYYGNPADPSLLPKLDRLKSIGLIDELIYYNTDLSLEPKENELILRNIGLAASRRAGCTHHISSDVDEFYLSEQLRYAKENMTDEDDFCMAQYEIYYKDPTFLVVPNAETFITLIHPVRNEYQRNRNFPFLIEITRRLAQHNKYKVFTKEQVAVHHMSYIRKDMVKKLKNNSNKKYYKKNFIKQFENHEVGDKVFLLPDFLARRTKKVDNVFGIYF